MKQSEMLALRGTVFTHIFPSGREVQTYIAEVDEKIGCTCKVFKASKATCPISTRNFEEGDEMSCFNFKRGIGNRESLVEFLEEIRDTGKFKQLGSGGNTSCAF